MRHFRTQQIQCNASGIVQRLQRHGVRDRAKRIAVQYANCLCRLSKRVASCNLCSTRSAKTSNFEFRTAVWWRELWGKRIQLPSTVSDKNRYLHELLRILISHEFKLFSKNIISILLINKISIITASTLVLIYHCHEQVDIDNKFILK